MPSLLGGTRVAVVLAMHDEAPGRDRDEILEAGLDPILGLDRVEGDVPAISSPAAMADEFAHQRLIRRFGEMHGDVPASVRPLERGERGLALEEDFGQEIDDALCGLFVADRQNWRGG